MRQLALQRLERQRQRQRQEHQRQERPRQERPRQEHQRQERQRQERQRQEHGDVLLMKQLAAERLARIKERPPIPAPAPAPAPAPTPTPAPTPAPLPVPVDRASYDLEKLRQLRSQRFHQQKERQQRQERQMMEKKREEERKKEAPIWSCLHFIKPKIQAAMKHLDQSNYVLLEMDLQDIEEHVTRCITEDDVDPVQFQGPILELIQKILQKTHHFKVVQGSYEDKVVRRLSDHIKQLLLLVGSDESVLDVSVEMDVSGDEELARRLAEGHE
jgi:hypothetical protein